MFKTNETLIAGASTVPAGRPDPIRIEVDNFPPSSDFGGVFIIIGAMIAIFGALFAFLLSMSPEERKRQLKIGFMEDDSMNMKDDSMNFDLVSCIEKLKDSDFPNASISESYIKSGYAIVKDTEGKILKEIKINQNPS